MADEEKQNLNDKGGDGEEEKKEEKSCCDKCGDCCAAMCKVKIYKFNFLKIKI